MTIDPAPPDRPVRRPASLLLTLLRPHLWSLPAIVGLGVLAALIDGVGLSLFMPLVDQVRPGAAANQPWWGSYLFDPFDRLPADRRVAAIGLAIFVAITFRAALNLINSALQAWLNTRITHHLRTGIHDRLLAMEIRHLERATPGSLLNVLTTEAWRTSDALYLVAHLLIAGSTIVVYTTLLLLLSPGLTAFVAVAILLISLVIRRTTRHAKTLGRHATKANARLTERMAENIAGMVVIRAFGRHRDEATRFDDASQDVARTFFRMSIISNVVGPLSEVLSAGLLVGIVVYSLQDPSNLSVLLVFMLVLYRLQPRVQAFEAARTELNALGGAIEAVVDLLDESARPALTDGARRAPRPAQAITFDEVTFRYDADSAPAIAQATCSIPMGQFTAVVGPSGAGKSTLIKLLLRLVDPDAGDVLVDGASLRDLQLASWRERIGFVGQDTYLFNTTIRENITYGRPNATDEAVREAVRLSHVAEFADQLPAGLETVVGDRGTRLSGGQRQRIALARAIIRDPDVLVLDEATNALDSRSERLIQDALDAYAQDRTVVVIAHRFSTIERADHVLVLDGGRITEHGNRTELLAAGGLFRELDDLQSREKE